VKLSANQFTRFFPWVLIAIILALTLPNTIKRNSPEGRRQAATSEAFNACYETFHGVDDQRFSDCLRTNVAPTMPPDERQGRR